MRRILGVLIVSIAAFGAERQFERLNRGVIATRVDTNTVAISWRLLATDPVDVQFDLYRSTPGNPGTKLNRAPILAASFCDDTIATAALDHAYAVAALVRGSQRPAEFKLATDSKPYHSIRLQTPEGYSPIGGSLGDLDGVGEYEIIIHQVGRGRDNS